MTKQSKTIYFFISLLFFVLCDLYLSDFILLNLNNLPENPLISLVYVQNEGAAFNLLQGSKIFLIFSSLLCAGIFSNMIERVIFGYVRDYIQFNFIDFPVFNISDAFINISVFAIVIIIIKNNYLKQNETDN